MFRCETYWWPNVLLHLAQVPRRLLRSWPPPASTGMMWSTWVLGCRLQTVQIGCSRSTTRLFFKYSGLSCGLLIKC